MLKKDVCTKCGAKDSFDVLYEGRDPLEWSEEKNSFIAVPGEEIEKHIECECGHIYSTEDVNIIYSRHNNLNELNKRIAEVAFLFGRNYESNDDEIEMDMDFIVEIAKASLKHRMENKDLEKMMMKEVIKALK